MQSGAMSMAYSAGDKLKSSARDFLRNLEAWKTQEEMPTTFETAIHKMFGSCTVGATSGVELQYDGGDDDEDTENPQLRKPVVTPEGMRTKRPLRPEFGEQVYEHLFMDDHPNAPLPTGKSSSPRAADSAREAEPKDSPKHLTVETAFPHPEGRPFGASSQQQKLTIIPAHMADARAPQSPAKVTTPLGSSHLIVPNRTFDDSISAVSAYTLEALANAEKLKHSPSNDSSLFPSSKDSAMPLKRPEPRLPISPLSPTRNFARKRSERTHASKNTKTSDTTGESSEHSKWINGEQQFWEQEANAAGSPKSFGVPKPFQAQRAKSQTVCLLECNVQCE